MTKGELDLSLPSAKPAVLSSWPLEQKLTEVLQWIRDNYDVSEDVVYDFSDWENDYDLEDHSDLYPESTSEIVLQYFGEVLTAQDHKKIVDLIDDMEGISGEWRPTEFRINVEELDEDEEPIHDFSDAKLQLESLLQSIDVIESSLFPHLGHNLPPPNLSFTAMELHQLRLLASEAINYSNEPSDDERTSLRKLAQLAFSIGKNVVSYALLKGDAFAEQFSLAAGKTAGEWAVKSLPLLYAGHELIGFSESIMRVVFGH